MTLPHILSLVVLFVLLALLARITAHAHRDIRSLALTDRPARTAPDADVVWLARLLLRRARLAACGVWVLAVAVFWIVTDGGHDFSAAAPPMTKVWIFGAWAVAILFAILSEDAVRGCRRYWRQLTDSPDGR